MKLFVFRLLFLLLFARAAPFVHADSGARVVKYSDSDIIPIRAKVRFSTLIVLPADEEILDFTTGDKDFWIINGVHNLCYLHPAQPGIRSNLNLVTASGHVYSFLLTEISKETDSDPDLKVFVTPNEEQASAGHPTTARFARQRSRSLSGPDRRAANGISRANSAGARARRERGFRIQTQLSGKARLRLRAQQKGQSSAISRMRRSFPAAFLPDQDTWKGSHEPAHHQGNCKASTATGRYTPALARYG